MSNPSSPRLALLRDAAQGQADNINEFHRREGREVHARIVEGWCRETPGSSARRQYEIVSDLSAPGAHHSPTPPPARRRDNHHSIIQMISDRRTTRRRPPAGAEILAGIFDAVFSATSVGMDAILSDSREPGVVRARWIAWTLATERHADLGLPEFRLSTRIGELFSRPRSTIRYGVRNALKSADPDFVSKLSRARAALSSKQPPTADDIIDRNFTGGVESVEHIRRVRDGEPADNDPLIL